VKLCCWQDDRGGKAVCLRPVSRPSRQTNFTAACLLEDEPDDDPRTTDLLPTKCGPNRMGPTLVRFDLVRRIGAHWTRRTCTIGLAIAHSMGDEETCPPKIRSIVLFLVLFLLLISFSSDKKGHVVFRHPSRTLSGSPALVESNGRHEVESNNLAAPDTIAATRPLAAAEPACYTGGHTGYTSAAPAPNRSGQLSRLPRRKNQQVTQGGQRYALRFGKDSKCSSLGKGQS
jgi:hypothetical protein